VPASDVFPVDEHSEICVESATPSPQAYELQKKDEAQVFPLNVDIEMVFEKSLNETSKDAFNFVHAHKGTLQAAGGAVVQMTNPIGIAKGFYGLGLTAYDYFMQHYGEIATVVLPLLQSNLVQIRDFLHFINGVNLPTNPRVFFTKLMLEMLMFQFGYQSESAADKEAIRTSFLAALARIRTDQTEHNLLVEEYDDAPSKLEKYEQTLEGKRVLTFDDFARVCLVRDSDMMQAIDVMKRDFPNFVVEDRRQIREMFTKQSSEIKCVIATLFYVGSKNPKSCVESRERRRLLHVLQEKLSYIQKIYNQVHQDRVEKKIVFEYSRFYVSPLSGSRDAHLMRLERQISPDSVFITNADKWRSMQLFGSVHYIFHHEVFAHLLKCFVRSPWSTAPVQTGITGIPELYKIFTSSYEQLKEILSSPVESKSWTRMEGFVELAHARNRLLLHCDEDWVKFQELQNQGFIVTAVGPFLKFLKESMVGLEPLVTEHIFKRFFTQPFLDFMNTKVNGSHIVQLALCLRDASELAVFSFNEMLPLLLLGIKPIFEASHLHENIGFTHSDSFCRPSKIFGSSVMTKRFSNLSGILQIYFHSFSHGFI
jgi:hypothetical protein